MREKPRLLSGAILGAVFALGLIGVVRADDASTTLTCPPVQTGQELRKIPEIRAKDHVLSTTFKLEMKEECVPVQNADKSWTGTPMNLRTYVFPDPDHPGKWLSGYPGPTLHIRKQTEVGGEPGERPTGPVKLTPGDRLKVLLENDLSPEPNGPHACNSACPASTVCPTDTSKLPNSATCGATKDPLCCCWVNVNQKWPDCFHGDNTTNLHFHGTHASPQPPQDYVLLELRPKLKAGEKPPANEHAVHANGVVAYGQYQYDVSPLPPTQAEGTHWYHPHKHGSVALQVANGLPGALIVEGPFDDWLNAYYHHHLAEKLLVLEQVQQNTNLFTPGAPAPPLLVNGQVTPKVTMLPGEVQRWRMVNATMQVASQVQIQFPSGTTVKQIAMDGVRFAPENYQRQPLFDQSDPTRKTFKISPGNRADFLVQAPTTPGTYHLRHKVFGNLSERTAEKVKLREAGLRLLQKGTEAENSAEAQAGPDLFTLVVEEPKPQAKGKAAPTVATGFPTEAQWPKMPWYLKDLPSKVDATQDLTFQMSAGPGDPATVFTINNIQYDDKCVNVTTKLDTVDQWNVHNTTPLGHPFHIHTNPFQLINDGKTTYQAPYPWEDTIALPAGSTTAPASVELRHRYLEFTGEYVLHCHFLGHEDRGMMFGVQTVCKDHPTSFGKARPFPQPECVPGNLIPASQQCATSPTKSAAGAASEPVVVDGGDFDD